MKDTKRDLKKQVKTFYSDKLLGGVRILWLYMFLYDSAESAQYNTASALYSVAAWED